MFAPMEVMTGACRSGSQSTHARMTGACMEWRRAAKVVSVTGEGRLLTQLAHGGTSERHLEQYQRVAPARRGITCLQHAVHGDASERGEALPGLQLIHLLALAVRIQRHIDATCRESGERAGKGCDWDATGGWRAQSAECRRREALRGTPSSTHFFRALQQYATPCNAVAPSRSKPASCGSVVPPTIARTKLPTKRLAETSRMARYVRGEAVAKLTNLPAAGAHGAVAHTWSSAERVHAYGTAYGYAYDYAYGYAYGYAWR